MGKTLKILLLGILFVGLAISLVYGAKLVDEYKIEKKDGKYYIYKLVEVIDDVKVKEDKDKLDKEIQQIDLELNSPEQDCTYCLFEFEYGYWDSIEECEEICFKDGSPITLGKKELLKMEKEELIKEKEELEKIK